MWALVAGILAGSLGVLGLGLNVMADVAGSVGLVWRFRVEQRGSGHVEGAERHAPSVLAAGFGVVALIW